MLCVILLLFLWRKCVLSRLMLMLVVLMLDMVWCIWCVRLGRSLFVRCFFLLRSILCSVFMRWEW